MTIAASPVTERKELGLSDQEAFPSAILEGSTEYSIVAKDLAGTILASNEGARRIYGYEPGDVVGKQSAFILHDPEDVASGRAQAILDEARAGGKWSSELGGPRGRHTRGPGDPRRGGRPRDQAWLAETLGKAGYAVAIAATGRDAVCLARGGRRRD